MIGKSYRSKEYLEAQVMQLKKFYTHIYIHLSVHMFICLLQLFNVHLDTYERSMEKLIQAQDTSNIDNDDTEMSSGEVRERKKRRRLKTKRKFSSSSEDK